MIERNGAIIRNIVEVLWETAPAHYDAHSKMLTNPGTCGTKRFDHRISSYQPKGYVEPHTHKVQEQIYHVLDGEGEAVVGGVHHQVHAGSWFRMPPRMPHSIRATTPLRMALYMLRATD